MDSNPFRYGGKYGYYSDGPSGMMLAGARWYSPNLKRWISRDPIKYEGDYNLYSYVEQNPVGYVDPAGEDKVRVLVETVKGIWKAVWLHPKDIVKNARRGKNVRIPGDEDMAEKTAREAWGDVVCHPPHGGKSKYPHFQPRKRKGRRGHVYYDLVIPSFLTLGSLIDEIFNPIHGGDLE